MWNPDTQVFEDIPGFIRQLRTIYPDVQVSPEMDEGAELPTTVNDDDLCGICVGGALLMYTVSENLLDANRLMEGYFADDYGGEPDPDEIPLNVENPALRWRFPSPIDLQRVLQALNPTLSDDEAWNYGEAIVLRNDEANFYSAYAAIAEALETPLGRKALQTHRHRSPLERPDTPSTLGLF